MVLPKKMYYVKVIPTAGKRLSIRQNGGGKYSIRMHAIGQYTWLKSQGFKVEFYETDLNWSLVDLDAEQSV